MLKSPMSGKDFLILLKLAENPPLGQLQINKVLKELQGETLSVARHLLGIEVSLDPKIVKVADYLRSAKKNMK